MPVRFYLIAVLFILFDIEVIFFSPWAIVPLVVVCSITMLCCRVWMKSSLWMCTWQVARRALKL